VTVRSTLRPASLTGTPIPGLEFSSCVLAVAPEAASHQQQPGTLGTCGTRGTLCCVTPPVTPAGYSSVSMKLTTVWDDRYSVDAASTDSTLKQARVVRMALHEGLLDLHPVAFEANLAWADIARVHAPVYVDAVRTGQPRHLAESQGFRWNPQFAESVALIWGGHFAACRLALDARVVFHPVSGAHHARRERGGGFCTFNFLAGASRRLLDEGVVHRVLVVDLDAHQGDGTHALTADDPRVALFDIAGSNWIGEFDTDRVIYKVARGPEDYRTHLARLPAMLDHFKPDLLQYQAGVDCHEYDPVGGIAGIDEAFLLERDRFVIHEVAARQIPLVINLAGGYEGFSERLHVQTARVALEAPRG
jgi:acetoin utilization deacetylase AcuC-like enzyme